MKKWNAGVFGPPPLNRVKLVAMSKYQIQKKKVCIYFLAVYALFRLKKRPIFKSDFKWGVFSCPSGFNNAET